jgi:hypothetical protein
VISFTLEQMLTFGLQLSGGSPPVVRTTGH